MGGDAVGMGPKAIAKKIKAKGLGRLRWFCQMCEKQCRDENGFKCHTATPHHQRQLVLFANEPERFVQRFSDTFLREFLSILFQRYGTNAVAANTVYQEYIKDRYHVHMNSTRWTTLTEFVTDLGKNGICRVEERDGAWWIVYIDAEAIDRKERANAIDRARLDEEERRERWLERQIERADIFQPHGGSNAPEGHPTLIVPDQDAGPIAIKLKTASTGPVLSGRANFAASSSPLRAPPVADPNVHGETRTNIFKTTSSSQAGPSATIQAEGHHAGAMLDVKRLKTASRRSVLDEIIEEECAKRASGHQKFSAPNSLERHASGGESNIRKKESTETTQSVLNNPKDGTKRSAESETPWLRSGIVVKVVADALRDGPYFRKKGVVVSIHDPYTCVVRLNDSAAVIQLDQDDVETVIPKPGGWVVFVHGPHRGELGTLMDIDEASYSARITLRNTGQLLSHVEYTDFCKINREA